ncbi:MAG: chemotaxis protein CheW [Rudaea sp.]|uniref:chemotaxis protein CheW n=1 Tax=Rudaea sp. TaxID=2136325 RepID=UPI0039E5507F
MGEILPREIHAVLIPVSGTRLLLPNATVAEIAQLADVEKIDGAPSWLLGRLPWREHMIPLVSFARMTGVNALDETRQARVIVLKTLDDRDGVMTHIGLLAQGLPRLTTITSDLLVRTDDGSRLLPGTTAHVLVRSDQAIIPDLHWIEAKVAQSLAA